MGGEELRSLVPCGTLKTIRKLRLHLAPGHPKTAQSRHARWSTRTNLFAAELHKQTVSDKLDVAFHQLAIHADQGHWKSIGQELLLDDDSVADDLSHTRLRWLVHQMTEHEAGEVGVQALPVKPAKRLTTSRHKHDQPGEDAQKRY